MSGNRQLIHWDEGMQQRVSVNNQHPKIWRQAWKNTVRLKNRMQPKVTRSNFDKTNEHQASWAFMDQHFNQRHSPNTVGATVTLLSLFTDVHSVKQLGEVSGTHQ